MLRVLGTIAAVTVLVAAPVAIGVGVTDTFAEQVNAAVDQRSEDMDAVMVDGVEEMLDGMEDEPPVFDPGDFMEPLEGQLGEQDLALYAVDGDEISEPQITEGLTGDAAQIAEDTESHERVWDLFSRITGEDYEDLIDTFVVFTDGPQNILAAVAPTPPGLDTWTFYIDGADLEDEDELLLTLAHEYAHILTLETGQVTYDEAFLDPNDGGTPCGDLVPFDQGCANAGSYWEAYYPFWEPLEQEHAAIDQLADEDEYLAALEDFYLEHQDEFVSSYAPTSQAEDMAESFSYWMVSDEDLFDGIAQEKIDFWNQFPELVAERENARAALGFDD